MNEQNHSLVSKKRSTRRGVARLTAGLVAAFLMLLAGPSVAFADDGSDGVPQQPDLCNPSAGIDHPGDGIPGWIDNQPTGGDGSTLYEQYGWSGLEWSTCQLASDGWGWDPMKSMPSMIQNPMAWLDVNAGNLMMGGAATLGALMTQLNEWVSDPSSIMAPIDGSLATASSAIQGSTWALFSGLLAIIAACLIVVWVMRGDIRKAMGTVVAILIAILSVAALGATVTEPPSPENSYTSTSRPGAVVLGQAFDGIASSVVGGVSGGGCGGATPNIAYGACLYDQILVPIQIEAATGIPCTIDQLRAKDNTAAGEFCYDLYRSITTNWDGNSGTDVSYQQIAYTLLDEGDADATKPYLGSGAGAGGWYDHMRGIEGAHAATGAKALVTMILISIIRIPCSLVLLMGLIVVRLVVMFLPIWALFAILPATRQTAIGAGKMVFAAVYNATVFGVFGAIYTIVSAGIITDTSSGTGFTIIKLVLIAALTVVVWVVSKPFRSVTVPATGDMLSGVGQNMAGSARRGLNAPLRVAGGIMAYKSYKRLQNVSHEEDRQTAQLQEMSRPANPPGGGSMSTYLVPETYATEPPRLPPMKVRGRNPIKQVQSPVTFRSPIDTSNVDTTTGEVHPRLQNPFQTQKPVTFQSPVYFHRDQPSQTVVPETSLTVTPSVPVPVMPTAADRSRAAARRITERDRAINRAKAASWTPPATSTTIIRQAPMPRLQPRQVTYVSQPEEPVWPVMPAPVRPDSPSTSYSYTDGDGRS